MLIDDFEKVGLAYQDLKKSVLEAIRPYVEPVLILLSKLLAKK